MEKALFHKISFGNGENYNLNFVGGISKRGGSIFRGTYKEGGNYVQMGQYNIQEKFSTQYV